MFKFGLSLIFYLLPWSCSACYATGNNACGCIYFQGNKRFSPTEILMTVYKNCDLFTPLLIMKERQREKRMGQVSWDKTTETTINFPIYWDWTSVWVGSCVFTPNCSRFFAREISSICKTFENHTCVSFALQKKIKKFWNSVKRALSENCLIAYFLL